MRLAATFGRFRIVQQGHIALIERMAQENDHVIVGISTRSRNLRSIHLLQARFPNVTVVYATTLFQMMNDYPEITNIYLGADRVDLAAAVQRYHTVDVTLLARPEGAPSSTACRQLYGQGASLQDFVQAGLAVDEAHSMQILAQCYLDQHN